MKHFVILFILLCAHFTTTHAQFTNGVTGLLHMPNAEMQKDGTFVIGSNYLNKNNLLLIQNPHQQLHQHNFDFLFFQYYKKYL